MLKINDILNGKSDGRKPGEMLPTGGEGRGQERGWECEHDEEYELTRPMDFCAFSCICRIKRGREWELLADNTDLLLANTEEIAARPEMAECEDVLVRAPGGKRFDSGDALRYRREKRGGWIRRAMDGHNLYAIELDGGILSGGCYVYRLLDSATKLTGHPRICQTRPGLRSAYSVRLGIKRAAHRAPDHEACGNCCPF